MSLQYVDYLTYSIQKAVVASAQALASFVYLLLQIRPRNPSSLDRNSKTLKIECRHG
jgi:hypothetical protein